MPFPKPRTESLSIFLFFLDFHSNTKGEKQVLCHPSILFRPNTKEIKASVVSAVRPFTFKDQVGKRTSNRTFIQILVLRQHIVKTTGGSQSRIRP